MGGIIFDTSVYIDSLRRGDPSVFNRRRSTAAGEAESRPLWLSAVVLEELYVGAGNPKMTKLLGKLEKEFENLNRLVVPNRNDWATCGQVLGLIGRKHGFEMVRRARMTNDCLIAMTATRCGLTVFTLNAADFRIIAEFRPFKWEEV